MARERTQAMRRRSYVNRDQFRRKWLVSIELETGEQTGLLTPAGWEDPMRTPQKFCHIPEHSPRELVVDYRAWYVEQNAGLRGWNTLCRQVGRQLYGDQFNEQAPPTVAILDAAGPKPFSPALIKRAAKGDQGLLGFGPLSPADRDELGYNDRQVTLDDLSEIPTWENEDDREAKLDAEFADAAGALAPGDVNLQSAAIPSKGQGRAKPGSHPTRPVRQEG